MSEVGTAVRVVAPSVYRWDVAPRRQKIDQSVRPEPTSGAWCVQRRVTRENCVAHGARIDSQKVCVFVITRLTAITPIIKPLLITKRCPGNTGRCVCYARLPAAQPQLRITCLWRATSALHCIIRVGECESPPGTAQAQEVRFLQPQKKATTRDDK
ncbi:hypothetical protein MRX96_013284 [Rhipicephalus microplus]